MSGAHKLVGLLLLLLFAVAFLNRGQVVVGSGPTGASLSASFAGLTR